MRRIYLATSWRNPHYEEMRQFLIGNRHEVYDFKDPGGAFSWSDANIKIPCLAKVQRKALLTHPRCAQGFMRDFRAMQWCDTCVLLSPCGRSAHLELGWCAGKGKRTIICMRDDEEPELMQLMADHLVINHSELLEALR